MTDDDGAFDTDTLVVTVRPIPAEIRFEPNTLNLKSEGNWVTVFVELPEGPSRQEWDVDLIDISTVRLNGLVPAVTDAKYGFVKNSSRGNPERMFKFDRSTVGEVLQVGEEVEVVISGKVLYNGEYVDFEGTAIIEAINPIDELTVKSTGNVPNDGKAKGKVYAPGQNKDVSNNAIGKAKGKESAPGQNKEPGNTAISKGKGKDDAPGQNKESRDNANGKAKGKEDAPGQNK